MNPAGKPKASRSTATRTAAAPGARILDVTVVLLHDGYASTAIGPIEVFHSAGLLWNWLHGESVEPRFRVQTASIDGQPVRGLCGLGLQPSCSIADVARSDIVVLAASGWDIQQHIARHTALVPWLRQQHERGAYIAGICSGVAFIAEAGLLDGCEATTHWALADILRDRYPNVRWKPENFVTEDGRVLCSGGVYAAIDLSLYLVEKFCGHDVAVQCARSLLVSMPRSRQSGYAVLPLARPHDDQKIRETEEYLQRHFARGVSIERLARRVGMSARNFIRRFNSATGRLPGHYLQMLRVAAAKELLEQGDLSIERVSSQVGYTDLAFFRTLFKRHTGMNPAEYRRNFARLDYARGELRAGHH